MDYCCYSTVILLLLGSIYLVLEWRFIHSPGFIWRRRLQAHVERLLGEFESLRSQDASNNFDPLASRLFQEYLRSQPSINVTRFSGIGPGAYERLRSAGLMTLADLVDYEFRRIPGFGPVKAKEMRSAVDWLVLEARATFESGACPQGAEYRRLRTQARETQQHDADVRAGKALAILNVLKDLEPLQQLAQDVTFFNHLFHRGIVPGLNEEILHRPFPEPKFNDEEARISPPPTSPPAAKQDLFLEAIQTQSVPQSTETGETDAFKELKAVCGILFLAAKADGKVAKAERKVIRDLLAKQYGHDAALVRRIDPMMEEIEKSLPEENDVIQSALQFIPASKRGGVHDAATQVAGATGDRNRRESELLTRIAAAFGSTSKPNPEKPSISTDNKAVDPRTILEIESGVEITAELIRRRYVLLTERIDPAKAAAMGPEFAAMAEKKRKDIRDAAIALIAPLGVPLEPPAAPPPTADMRHNPDLDDVFGG